MASVGERLRQAREERGLTLPQLAVQTRISSHYLEAIEADRPESLPGRFFYKSFAQQYARAVGVEDDEIRRDLERSGFPEAASLAAEPERARPSSATSLLQSPPVERSPVENGIPRTPSRLGSRLALFGLVLAICTGLYAAWDWLQNRPTVTASTPSHSATRISVEASAKPTAAPASPAPPASGEQSAAQAGKPSQTAVLPPEPAAAPASAKPISVTVSATDSSWLRVVADGKQVFDGVLKTGESRTFSGSERATLRTGNAGSLDVAYNGKPIGPLGPKGQIRTVTFTPERFEIKSPLSREEAAGSHSGE